MILFQPTVRQILALKFSPMIFWLLPLKDCSITIIAFSGGKNCCNASGLNESAAMR
jgi:hypothetical protein